MENLPEGGGGGLFRWNNQPTTNKINETNKKSKSGVFARSEVINRIKAPIPNMIKNVPILAISGSLFIGIFYPSAE
jgi:hypothetical protein